MIRPQTLKDLQIRAGERARILPPPERYLWTAVWWHLESRTSAAPEICLGYAKGQLRLAKDMAKHPGHYRYRPSDKTDWQWFQSRTPPSFPTQTERVEM